MPRPAGQVRVIFTRPGRVGKFLQSRGSGRVGSGHPYLTPPVNTPANNQRSSRVQPGLTALPSSIACIGRLGQCPAGLGRSDPNNSTAVANSYLYTINSPFRKRQEGQIVEICWTVTASASRGRSMCSNCDIRPRATHAQQQQHGDALTTA